MDIINKINNRYTLLLQERFYSTEYQQFKKLLYNYNIHDKEKTLVLKPYFITLKQRQEFSKITEVLLNVFEKLTNAYYNNNEIRTILSINGRVRDYIGVNPGYSRKQLVVRLDAFYNFSNNLLQFLEVNFDDPSGMGESDLLLKIYDRLPSIEFLRNEYEISMDILVDALYKMLLNKYKEYCLNFGKQEQVNPHIAVVCSRNSFNTK